MPLGCAAEGHHSSGELIATVRTLATLLALWIFTVAAESPISVTDLYAQCCATCHGMNGNGNGPSAATLSAKPCNFTDCRRMATISDETAFKVIKRGGAANGLNANMPSWSDALTDEQIRMVIGYVRHFCKG